MTKQSKREGESLTKDDLDLDNEGDTAAHHAIPFEKASADVLAQRKIRRVVKPIAPSASNATVAANPTPSSSSIPDKPANPFAFVSLTAPKAAAAPVEPTETLKEVAVESNKQNGDASTDASLKDTSKRSRVASTNDGQQTEDSANNGVANNDDAAAKPSVFGAAAASLSNPPVFGTATSTSTGFGGFGVTKGTPTLGFGTSAGFGFAAANGTGFGSSQSTTVTGFGSFATSTASSSSTPFTFGVKAPAASDAKTDEPSEAPEAADTHSVLPDTYEVKSGEEDEVCVLELRVRTWRKATEDGTDTSTTAPPSVSHASVPPSAANFATSDTADATAPTAASATSSTEETKSTSQPKLVEVGKGPLRVLRRRDESGQSSTRLVQRQELSPNGPATKVILNVRLSAGSTTYFVAPESNMYVRLVTINQGTTESLTFKFFGSAQDAAKFVSTLDGIMAVGDKKPGSLGASVDVDADN